MWSFEGSRLLKELMVSLRGISGGFQGVCLTGIEALSDTFQEMQGTFQREAGIFRAVPRTSRNTPEKYLKRS